MAPEIFIYALNTVSAVTTLTLIHKYNFLQNGEKLKVRDSKNDSEQSTIQERDEL